jgi:hypothetical protein
MARPPLCKQQMMREGKIEKKKKKKKKKKIENE